tara:strand:- start:2724 stop:3761 length:1038 start_codon:yes stop_codon:yes gene_type:complete
MELIIHKVALSLIHSIKAAHSETDLRPTILLELVLDDVSLWSEAPAFIQPNYMPETHDLLWERLQVMGADILAAFVADQVDNLLGKLQQFPILSSAIDMLYCQWDARNQQQSLADYFDILPRQVLGSAMIGFLDSNMAYMERLEQLKASGYTAVKFKVDPDHIDDLQPILTHSLDLFESVCVDANGSFSPSNIQRLAQIPELVVIEQPTLHTPFLMQLVRTLPHQILLDESIRSLSDLDSFSGTGVGVMLKPVCLGGLRLTLQYIQRCFELGIPCGISGYLDSGVGRYFQWLLAQHSQCLLRADFVWSGYYFKKDVMTISSDRKLADPFRVDLSGFEVQSRQFSR